jgi:hypothetical protein
VTVGAAGTSLAVDVYVRESAGGTTLSGQGLNTAGVLLTTSTPAGGARVLADGDIVGNVTAGGFSNTGPLFYVRDASYEGDAARHRLTVADNPGEFVLSGGAGGHILVGTFTFAIEGPGAGTITASEVPDDTYNTLSDGSPIVVSNAVLNFAPVPEPAYLLPLAAFGLYVARPGDRFLTHTRM